MYLAGSSHSIKYKHFFTNVIFSDGFFLQLFFSFFFIIGENSFSNVCKKFHLPQDFFNS